MDLIISGDLPVETISLVQEYSLATVFPGVFHPHRAHTETKQQQISLVLGLKSLVNSKVGLSLVKVSIWGDSSNSKFQVSVNYICQLGSKNSEFSQNWLFWFTDYLVC